MNAAKWKKFGAWMVSVAQLKTAPDLTKAMTKPTPPG